MADEGPAGSENLLRSVAENGTGGITCFDNTERGIAALANLTEGASMFGAAWRCGELTGRKGRSPRITACRTRGGLLLAAGKVGGL
jgi:hypothetical protein